MTVISWDDAMAMYLGSMVQVENQLMWVADVARPEDEDDNPRLLGFNMEDAKPLNVEANPDEVMAPTLARLGYVNQPTNAFFCSRVPSRQYKVGWCENNVSNWTGSYLSKWRTHFMKMIKGEYPSFEEAVEKVIQNGGRVAFDKQWAVDTTYVHFCGDAVGHIRNGRASFVDANKHLTENFVKSGGVL